jgi:hypothetical protein
MPFDIKIGLSFMGFIMISVTVGNMVSAPVGFLTMGGFLIIYPIYERLFLFSKRIKK